MQKTEEPYALKIACMVWEKETDASLCFHTGIPRKGIGGSNPPSSGAGMVKLVDTPGLGPGPRRCRFKSYCP